ncbi:MAG: hypothetical protein COA84_09725 [Robiginitomaculum sp.]|nr:MAG: hypothetical protein COA84_09725 [Robiginitomaculum sp.]
MMMNKLFTELRRRNIFRVAGVYAVVGWILMQVAGALETSLKLPDWFDSAITATLLIGFPIAVLLAWAFEMTPEGVKRTETVAEGTSATAKPGRTLDVIIVIGLVLVVTTVIWQGARSSPAPFEAAKNAVPQGEGVGVVNKNPHPEERAQQASKDTSAEATNIPDAASIAVLPFTDLSPGKDQEYFSDGMAEEILNVLVKVQGLSVASRTSSFQFKGRELGIPEIANTLNVRHVLEGSVRKSGNTLRITAQLIDASNDRHLWSQTYDRPLTAENIFQIQDEIAQAIVDALGKSIAVLAKAEVVVDAPTENLTAYELYLKARPLYLARAKLDIVDQLLGRAVEQDSDFAKAWEMRAATNMLMPEYSYTEFPEEEYMRRAVEYAGRALAADPDSATAIAVRADIRIIKNQTSGARNDIGKIIEEFKHALAIDPRNGSALNWLGLAYGFIGDLDAALDQFTTCAKVEPYYAPCVENEYDALASMGRMEEARIAFEAALDSGAVTDEWGNTALLAYFERKQLFMFATNQSRWLPGWRRHEAIYDAWRNIGADHSALVADIRAFAARTTEKRRDTFLANLLIPLGAYDMQPSGLNMWSPENAGYRKSDEFDAYIRQSGVFDYWRKNGFPPQCKPVGADDFACD